jgi:uncharacterized protein YceK
MKTALLIVALMLSGCATCERHPVYCSAAAGVVATSIALSVNHDTGDHAQGWNYPEHRH